jgi:hypothetical protein
MRCLVAIPLLAGCGSSGPAAGDDAPDPDAAVIEPPDPEPATPLEVTALGVQGFALRHGNDVAVTAPLFTRQSMVEVALATPLPADVEAIDHGMMQGEVPLDQIRAVISGHAHYDHFMDVPRILELAPNAIAYTNRSGRNMLAALAPDRPAGCTNTPETPLARSRVVALDDELASKVDYTNCLGKKPAGAPVEGTWVKVPGSNVRVMALCSMHPDQIGPFHFGEGSVDEEQCELPAAASGWLEGLTLAYLIDFLDASGTPVHRVFYQDAPTDAPIGMVPPALLAERTVDLALLCVGSNDAVANEPTAIIENVQPRVVLSGHWEDFFAEPSAGDPPPPIPFLDLDTYVQRAEAALPGPPDGELLIDGIPSDSRHVLAMPGMQVTVPVRF